MALLLLLLLLKEISIFNANSVDSDQMPRSVASYLGLHCLLMSLSWNARYKLVNTRGIKIGAV